MVYAIYCKFEPLPTEFMQTSLTAESNAMCKCTTFIFIAYCTMDKAIKWIFSIYDTVGSLDKGLQWRESGRIVRTTWRIGWVVCCAKEWGSLIGVNSKP
jgi:hypothetical protein